MIDFHLLFWKDETLVENFRQQKEQQVRRSRRTGRIEYRVNKKRERKRRPASSVLHHGKIEGWRMEKS